MSRFEIITTPIEGLHAIKSSPVADERGFLERMFCLRELESVWGDKPVRQLNRTLTTKKGTVRGMHFQYPPYAEQKLVKCLHGEVLDVAVDLRKGSPTFLQHHAIILNEVNNTTFFIPEGFAHGFQALTAKCELFYVHSADYTAEAEGGLNATDPLLSIEWPLVITERSQRDELHSAIENNFEVISLK